MKSVRVGKVNHKAEEVLSFPGDKSLSHRAVIFGSLAEGESSFTNVLSGEDCVCTQEAFRTMGVEMISKEPTKITVLGRGFRSLNAPRKDF